MIKLNISVSTAIFYSYSASNMATRPFPGYSLDGFACGDVTFHMNVSALPYTHSLPYLYTSLNSGVLRIYGGSILFLGNVPTNMSRVSCFTSTCMAVASFSLVMCKHMSLSSAALHLHV